MTDRRQFLRGAGVALAAGIAVPRLLHAFDRNAGAPPVDRIKRIGLELYTVRDAMEKNVERTLARVAQIGYKEVEFAGYFERTPAQVRHALKANGLAAPSTHIGLGDIRAPNLQRTLDSAHKIGHQWIIVAWIDDKDRQSQDDYKAIADSMIAASIEGAKAGVSVGYHNHDFEFVTFDGKTGLEVMLDRTAQTAVAIEMDLYWAIMAGQDPLAWFAKYPGRFPLVHVKDSAGAPKHEMRDVGAGSIDWKNIFAHREQAGIKHYFVEHDEPGDAFASAAASYKYLHALTF